MNCEKIKQLRKAKSFTQIHLSEKMNMSQNAYSLMENGKTPLDNDKIIILAKILETTPHELLNEEELMMLRKLCQKEVDEISTKPFDHDLDTIKYLKELLHLKDSQIEKLLKQNKILVIEARKVQKVIKSEKNRR